METFAYCYKMALCSGLMWVYYRLFLRDKTFHHYNRFYLLATVLISVLVPLLKVDYFTIATDSRLLLLLKGQAISSTTESGFSWIPFIYPGIFAISALFVLRLTFGLLKIYRLKQSFDMRNWNRIHFYLTDLPQAPFSFFRSLFWKKSIEIESPLGQQILKHELIHIEQKHSWDRLFIETVTALFWFNPFFYLIKNDLFLIHEYLADQKAVKQKDTKAFAQMLLASHFKGSTLSVTSPFLASNLKKRLKMLTKKKTRFGYFRKVMALPLLFIIGFVLMVQAKNKVINQTNRAIAAVVKMSTQDTTRPKEIIVQVPGNLRTKIVESKASDVFSIDGSTVSKNKFLKLFDSKKIKNYDLWVSPENDGKTYFEAISLNHQTVPTGEGQINRKEIGYGVNATAAFSKTQKTKSKPAEKQNILKTQEVSTGVAVVENVASGQKMDKTLYSDGDQTIIGIGGKAEQNAGKNYNFMQTIKVSQPIVLINGIQVPKSKLYEVNPADIKSMRVLKGKNSGQGTIEIQTK